MMKYKNKYPYKYNKLPIVILGGIILGNILVKK